MNKIKSRINIVILANIFNPAIPTKEWLIKNKIFEKEPITFSNSNIFSGFESEDYLLEIDLNRFNFNLKNPESINLEDMKTKIFKYVTALPETPYTAIGFNLIWSLIADDDENLPEHFKSIYINNIKNLNKILECENYKAGVTFIYKDSDILKTIKISPIINNNNYEVTFNFHKDLNIQDKKIDLIKNYLENIDNYYKKANQIIDDLLKKGN